MLIMWRSESPLLNQKTEVRGEIGAKDLRQQGKCYRFNIPPSPFVRRLQSFSPRSCLMAAIANEGSR
jgi:hypothetical protein